MFQTGECLLYGTEGICKIAEICEMKVGGAKAEYYVLQSVFREGSTIFVPTENAALTAKMRTLLTAEEIHAMLDRIQTKKMRWLEDATERKTEFQKILAGGERFAILQMIHLLYLRREKLLSGGKRMRSNDEQMLRDAEKLMYEEVSFVLGLPRREAAELVRSRMKESLAKTAEAN